MILHRDTVLLGRDLKGCHNKIVITKDTFNYVSQIRYYCSLVGIFGVTKKYIDELLMRKPITIIDFKGYRKNDIIIYYSDFRVIDSYFYMENEEKTYNISTTPF